MRDDGTLADVPRGLDEDPAAAMALCRASHARLLTAVQQLTDRDVRRPSRLPSWTIGHVLTHLARNADGHVRRLDGALHGEDLARYPGGAHQRDKDIEHGARLPAADIVADLGATQRRLEDVWEESRAADWPNADLYGDDKWPTTASPVRRLREVEVHHVDLGLGYETIDWPEEYVRWELPVLLATVPGRLRRTQDARDLLSWLAGRAPAPAVELDPW